MTFVLADYTTPVSVDTFGSYPGKKPGDMFEVMYHGKVYMATVQSGEPLKQPDGSVLRNIRFQQVAGPVIRRFVEDEQLTRFLSRKRRH